MACTAAHRAHPLLSASSPGPMPRARRAAQGVEAASQGLETRLWSPKHGLCTPTPPSPLSVALPVPGMASCLPQSGLHPAGSSGHTPGLCGPPGPGPRSGQQGQRHSRPRLHGVRCISQRETLSRRDIWGLSQSGSGGFHSDCPSLRRGRALYPQGGARAGRGVQSNWTSRWKHTKPHPYVVQEVPTIWIGFIDLTSQGNHETSGRKHQGTLL